MAFLREDEDRIEIAFNQQVSSLPNALCIFLTAEM